MTSDALIAAIRNEQEQLARAILLNPNTADVGRHMLLIGKYQGLEFVLTQIEALYRAAEEE